MELLCWLPYLICVLHSLATLLLYYSSRRKGYTILGSYFLKVKSIIKNRVFISGVIIASGGYLQQMIYPAVGAFIVEGILHRTAIAYGNSALLISCGYLLGTLTNRLYINKLHLHHLIRIGFLLLMLGVVLQIIFYKFGSLNLFTLIVPILIMGYSNGFIFPNVMGHTLKTFYDKAGIATAMFSCCLVAITSLGIFVVSHINVSGLKNLSIIFSLTILMQLLSYFCIFKREV